MAESSLLSKVSDAIRGGTVGKEMERSAMWFREKITGLKGELRNQFSRQNAPRFYREAKTKVNPNVLKIRGNLGDLYCYNYDPKYKDVMRKDREGKTYPVLPYYDTFPLIMLVGYEKESFLGLNFHYLNPRYRALLLDRVNKKIGKGIVSFDKIAQIPQVAPAVHRYRFDHIKKRVIPIEESEQELAIFLPLERFRGQKRIPKTTVWKHSRKKMG